jgi:hypothetical protein
MRQLVANNTQKITNKNNTLKGKGQIIYTKREQLEWNTIKSLCHKIIQNQLIITKAEQRQHVNYITQKRLQKQN